MKKFIPLLLFIFFTSAFVSAQEPVAKNIKTEKVTCTKDNKTCCKSGNLRAAKKTVPPKSESKEFSVSEAKKPAKNK